MGADPGSGERPRRGYAVGAAGVAPGHGAGRFRIAAARGLWAVAALGVAAFVFAVVALSGPGRIDIVDGQARYEVARSLVDHGDSVIRDERVWFSVFTGRDGLRYSMYRFPHSVAGAAALLLSDLTGPAREARRHFFFVLVGAVACAALAVTYLFWFGHAGLTPQAAGLWACAGVFCTPSWFYGTSTFDDILGTSVVVAAMVGALAGRGRLSPALPVTVGLLLGLAFNCKQPLAIFALPALAALDDPRFEPRRRALRAGLTMAGLAAGVAVYAAYNRHKFPPGALESQADLLRLYVPVWRESVADNAEGFVAAVVALGVSPAAGIFWYCPAVVLGLAGFRCSDLADRRLRWAFGLAAAMFVGFLCSMAIFKGDPSWGPRYLTPLFAISWLFAPMGAERMRRRPVAWLLVAGLLVQLLGLSVDPHRLYVERDLPSAFFYRRPWLYLHPSVAHVTNRPREILAIARRSERPPDFTPAPEATWAFPIIDFLQEGHRAIGKYQVLASFRPWWISQWHLSPAERPVDLARTAALLMSAAGLALGAAVVALRGLGRGEQACRKACAIRRPA